MLPGLSGLEICRRLRLEQIGTPIIFLTARDTVQETIEGLRCANDYIKKPFSFEELLERIKWRIRLLWFIDQGHKRSSELQRKIPDATRRVLNIQLKELEEHELVSKVIFPVVPPKVYSLTDFGKTLIPVIATIGNWGDEHEERLRSLILKRLDNTKHM
jgi:DNA-binding HxlR family transcriptional regulator